MAYSPERIVLISRACINIDSNAGEGPWQGFRCDTYAIWKGSYLIELDRVLY